MKPDQSKTGRKGPGLVFLLAAWHNFIGGMLLAFLGRWLYEQNGIPYGPVLMHYAQWVGLIFVFGVAYWIISRDPYANRKLILMGILGKTASTAPIILGLAARSPFIPSLFIIPAITDSLFGIYFLYFFTSVSRKKGWVSVRI